MGGSWTKKASFFSLFFWVRSSFLYCDSDLQRIGHAWGCLCGRLTLLSISSFWQKEKLSGWFGSGGFPTSSVSLNHRGGGQPFIRVHSLLNLFQMWRESAIDLLMTESSLLIKMDIKSLSLLILNCSGGFLNWLAKGEPQTAMQDAVFCCGKMISDKWDTAVNVYCFNLLRRTRL